MASISEPVYNPEVQIARILHEGSGFRVNIAKQIVQSSAEA
jgi:hypothetical protein